jgi:hypothetical protein
VLAARVHALRTALDLIQEREALDRMPLPHAVRGLERDLASAEAMLRGMDTAAALGSRGLVAALETPAAEARLTRAHAELQSIRADLAADRERSERREWTRAAKAEAVRRAEGAYESHLDWWRRLNDDASEVTPAPLFTLEG